MGILALEPDPQQWLTVPNENVEALKPPIEIEEQSKPSKLKAILPAVGIVITVKGMLLMIISRGRMIGTSLGTLIPPYDCNRGISNSNC